MPPIEEISLNLGEIMPPISCMYIGSGDSKSKYSNFKVSPTLHGFFAYRMTDKYSAILFHRIRFPEHTAVRDFL